MKYAIIMALSFVAFNSMAEQVQTERVFTSAGYPYKNLIIKAERVELIYSEDKDKTSCRVKVYKSGNLHESEPMEVSQKAFSSDPVQSCLARQNAKQILSLL
ncbi:hypothetical protein [Pseudoalteromonas luteoviolacea]|uniref:Uncharacterized protein n=1 Tax=Pseudoalteromonas luteoviolacea NCIMB 1942 TaxID=1365253 RepID=A0A162A412_9GAMM|nr:hypothetical protein [Pseudoalteromonas luteoviolacea]KZN43771.1 hypothetical protein N482_18790 [Pseudoalteromonas luteoviolacea NCIMB 1942]KZW98906.1 hypothetical protein JL49_20455 [Pseudoalteromonas luteoviolacea]